MIRFLKISLLIIWGSVGMLLIGNIFVHAVLYIFDGTTEKFFSPIWIGILLATGLICGSFYLTITKARIV